MAQRHVGRASVGGGDQGGNTHHVRTAGGSYTGSVHTGGGAYTQNNVRTGGGIYAGGNVSGHHVVGRDDNRIYNVTSTLPHYTLLRTGRVLMILGWLTFFAGFGMFGYVVVGFLTKIWGSIGSNNPEPPDMSGIAVVPYLPLGACLAAVGIFFSIMGTFFVRRAR